MRFAAFRLRATDRRTFREHSQFIALCGLLLLLTGVPGCGKSSGKAAVHGRVSYRGAPLESASLTFFPEKGRAEAATVSNGEYSAELLPGEYSAIVLIGVNVPPGYKEGDPIPPPKVVLPEEYTSRTRSTLKATVKAGQKEPIDFELK